jgi:hypothetical protein
MTTIGKVKMKISYEFTDAEISKLTDWLAAQNIDNELSPINGQITFCITETSIGTAITVRNNLTKEEYDITDYSVW